MLRVKFHGNGSSASKDFPFADPRSSDTCLMKMMMFDCVFRTNDAQLAVNIYKCFSTIHS